MKNIKDGFGLELSSIPECIREAYACLWHYRIQHVLIAFFAFFPFCLAGYLGWFAPLFQPVAPNAGGMPEGFHLSFLLLLLTTFFWAIPSLVLWHRLFLLGPEHLIRRNFWPLMTRSLGYIARFLIFFGLMLLLALGLGAVILFLMDRIISLGASSVAEIGLPEMTVYLTGAGLAGLITFIVVIRLSLAFSAQAIGKRLSFRASWDLTRKQTGPMVLSTLLSLLPALLLLVGLQYSLEALFSGFSPALYSLLFLLAPLLSLPLAMFCAQTAVYYRACGACHHREDRA